MAQFYVIGSIFSSSMMVGFSYVMVLALKCVMTCESGKGPVWGL